MKLCLAFAIVVALPHLFHTASPSKKPKSVTTLINSKWEATPFTLEIVEYLAEENKDSMWSFIDAVTSLTTPLVSHGK